MTDEEKPAGQVEEAKQSTPQPSEQQKPPENQSAAPVPDVAAETDTSETAITAKVNKATQKVAMGEVVGLPQALPLSFGGEPGSAKWFKRLPVSMSTSDLPPETPRWRIELVGLAPTVEPMGLEVVGDTVIGRGRVGTEPADLDLDMFGALEKGVSRRHGLFRPTTNHLYIIDLGSTNGTLHNGIPLGPGVARALKHNDTITLGRFSFTIKIVDGPTMRRAAEPERMAVITTAEDAEQTRPLKVMDASEVKAKKAKLAPPTFDPASPETAKLPPGEAAKHQPELSAANVPSPESKPPAASETPPSETMPAGEAQPPANEAKPSGAASEAKPPAAAETPPEDEEKPPKRASLLGE